LKIARTIADHAIDRGILMVVRAAEGCEAAAAWQD
jgi:hypothetical protein